MKKQKYIQSLSGKKQSRGEYWFFIYLQVDLLYIFLLGWHHLAPWAQRKKLSLLLQESGAEIQTFINQRQTEKVYKVNE